MELIGVGTDLSTVVSSIDYINLQWNRKYFETGDFSVQLLQKDYDGRVRYICSPDRPEVGIVEKIQTSSNITGDYIQVSGHFLEAGFSRDIICPRFSKNGRPSELAREIIGLYAVNFPGGVLSLAENSTDLSEPSVDINHFGTEVDDATFALLKQVGKSQRITFDSEKLSFVYEIWQGLDRTQNQSKNDFALFSDATDSDEINITEDESGYKNFACIALKDDRVLEYDGRAEPTEEKRIKFIECSSLSPSEEQTQEEFEASCIQKAKEELAKWPRIVNVEIEASQDNKHYLVDYDLGDLCDVVNHKIKKSYQSRIIEVHEVFKEGKSIVDLVFGEKIPTIYERVKNR